MTPREAYDELIKLSLETSYLGSTAALLHWDQRTCIPDKGHEHRVGQITTMAELIHRRITDPRIGELLSSMEDSDLTAEPSSVEAVNIREWRRSYDKATKIPDDLASALARTGAEGQTAWQRARPGDDWNAFKPYLNRIVALKREQAEALGYDHEPYDALLDRYEPGETAQRLEPILAGLRAPLIELLDRIQGATTKPDPSLNRGVFPIGAQEAFAKEVAADMGYDITAGRLDVSAHPFTVNIGPGDVRITTRYSENLFNEGFFAVIHEAGHGIHHQGLPVQHWGAPMCGSISLGISESQSRMWENMVARSAAFWKRYYGQAQERFACLSSATMEDFLLSVNAVTPSLIRVEADEVTYNLHILLRFELEMALMRNELEVDDLPDAWNQRMEKYLGLTPPNYADGVMQDVHWSGGSIGYFPTYTLGNLYAAQFFAKADRDLGGLFPLFERGDFSPLLGWLREKVHKQGTRYLPRDLVTEVTGEDLNPQYLIDYLNGKYEELYGL